eukprot:scaffold552_cov526-Prasinococcus_capsulatus_cf.AAC.33
MQSADDAARGWADQRPAELQNFGAASTPDVVEGTAGKASGKSSKEKTKRGGLSDLRNQLKKRQRTMPTLKLSRGYGVGAYGPRYSSASRNLSMYHFPVAGTQS